MKTLTGLVIAMAVAGCGAAQAHEMFLRPAAHELAPGASTTITLVTGTFDDSANPVARERMRDVSVIAAGQVSHPPATQWRDDETTSYLDLRVAAAGTHVIGVSTLASVITLPASDFNDYLRHDGIEDTLRARLAQPSDAPVRERYSKHVKTAIQVGADRTADFSRVLNYPAEIVPTTNPTTVAQGDSFTFRALLHGKPMAQQLVYASYEGHHSHDDDGGHSHAYRLRTNASGEASFKITQPGKWFVTLINMQRVDQPDADYESNWATFTFQAR